MFYTRVLHYFAHNSFASVPLVYDFAYVFSLRRVKKRVFLASR